jgi:hypothetical protein
MKNQVNAGVVLAAVEEKAAPILKKLNRIDLVLTQADYEKAMSNTKQLKELLKLSTDKKEAITTPLKEALKEVNSLFKPFEVKVEQMEAEVKAAMLQFVLNQQRQIKKLNQDFADGKIKKVSTITTKLAEFQQPAGVRKVWQPVEINAAATPREYLMPDMAKIKEALKAGKKVQGWSWEQVENIAI